MVYDIGLDIGGTKCAVSIGATETAGAANGVGAPTILAREAFPTGQNRPPMEILDALYDTANAMLARLGLTFGDVRGIGISCGGPLDAKKGVILSPPNLPMWDNIEIVSYFASRTGVKPYLQNDANACAVAEWKYGAGYDRDTGTRAENMIFCTFGTGLGAGLILNGKLYSGTNDMAGEVGHLRLVPDIPDRKLPVGYHKRGSAEGYCSGGGIAQLGQFAVERALAEGEHPLLWERAEHDPARITARLIAALADEGDALCLSVYEECAEKLGQTLAIFVDLLNPSLIVLGGVFMRSEHLLRPTMERVLQAEALSFSASVCEIRAAGLGESIGDYAALSVAAGDF